MMHAPMEVEETGKSKTGPSSSSSPASSKRWNPTKEQISLLEGMYKQGVRTPSSEQIQQITGKLREYGSIEGKNVFYWFQNHKARQRQKQKQKQKQENVAYFSRLLNHHHHPPPPPIPPPLAPPSSCTNNNAVCTPYYVPASHVGCVGFLPPHFPAILLPTTAVVGESSYFPITAAHFSELEGEIGRRRNSTDHRRERCDGPAIDVHHGRGRDCSQETLQLFPLHPTWFSEERRRSESGRTPTSESTEEESVVMEVDGDDLVAASRDLFGSRGSRGK